MHICPCMPFYARINLKKQPSNVGLLYRKPDVATDPTVSTMRPHHKPKDSHSHHQHPAAGNRRTGWYEKFTVSKQQQAYQYIECVGMIRMFPKIVVPPKSSILIGFSIINHPFWGTPIFGNTYKSMINTSHQDDPGTERKNI